MAGSTKSDNPHENHRQRMREKFIENGLSAFKDHEVLEFMLFYVIRRGNTNVQGHKLLKKFGTIEGVLSAPISQLQEIEGIGYESALYIKFLNELFAYYNKSKHQAGIFLIGSEFATDTLHNLFKDAVCEELYVICLNASYNIIRVERLSSGDMDSASVDPKKIMRFVLSNNAHAVVLAHNHPSGTLIPSNNDILVTKMCEYNFSMTGIKFIDHIIVAGDEYISIKKHPLYNARDESII